MGFLLIFLSFVFITLHAVTYRRYQTITMYKANERYRHIDRWLPSFLWLIDKLYIWRQGLHWTIRLHHLQIALEGPHHSFSVTKLSIARMVLFGYLFLVACTALGWGTESGWEMAGLGAGGALLAPFVQLRILQERLKVKRRRMLLELPEIVNQVLLLTNAGETARQALHTCVCRSGSWPDDRPLLKELRVTVQELQLNVSLSKALDDFQKRCGLQEVTMFVSTLLLQYKKGSDDLTVALRALSKELWEKRKAVSRTMGEEASAKLVFPMVLVFLIVMIIVAAPAVMMMNN